MTINSSDKKRILWAVDTVGSDNQIQAHTAKALEKFTEKLEGEIEPVFLFVGSNRLLGGRGISSLYNRIEEEKAIRQDFESWLGKMKLRNLKPIKILKVAGHSKTAEAKVLVDYAKSEHVDLIGVSTHARKGVVRAFMGSFAESLLTCSSVPVMVVNPASNVNVAYKKILFPTDFGQASKEAFLRALNLAKDLAAKMILYSKVETFSVYAVPIFTVPYSGAYFREDAERKGRAASAWKKLAEKKGVRVRTIIDQKNGTVEDSIVKIATEQKVDMIAMASQSGSVSAGLLGSVARQVVRNARCPVWVIHPEGRRHPRERRRVGSKAEPAPEEARASSLRAETGSIGSSR